MESHLKIKSEEYINKLSKENIDASEIKKITNSYLNDIQVMDKDVYNKLTESIDESRVRSVEQVECGSSDGNTQAKPNQVHHFATNKSKKYTKRFEKIANKYKLDLDYDWNKELMPHQGRHPYEYHDYMLEQMKKIDIIANGDRNKFLKLYEQLKKKVMDKPEMLTKDYWKNK